MFSTKHLNNELWKCIGCIILIVAYGKKGYKLWEINTKRDSHNAACLISRDVCVKIYLLEVSCPLYSLHYSFLCH